MVCQLVKPLLLEKIGESAVAHRVAYALSYGASARGVNISGIACHVSLDDSAEAGQS